MAPANLTLEAPRKLMTVDEFWDFVNLPDNEARLFELHKGEVIELSRPNRPHAALVANFSRILGNYADESGRGHAAAGDGGVVLDHDTATVVGPDVAYYMDVNEFDNLPDKWGGDLPVLVVEILSPNDRPGLVTAKVDEYLVAGVKSVWVADPDEKSLTINRSGSKPVTLAGTETVTCPELPGFSSTVAAFFRLPGGRQTSA